MDKIVVSIQYRIVKRTASKMAKLTFWRRFYMKYTLEFHHCQGEIIIGFHWNTTDYYNFQNIINKLENLPDNNVRIYDYQSPHNRFQSFTTTINDK